MSIKLNIKHAVWIFVALMFTLLMLIRPESAMLAAKEAMSLCAGSVIPALFPFFVCSGLLVSLNLAGLLGKFTAPIMRPLFGLSGNCSLALVMGLISGYPVGAKTVTSLVELGSCSKSEGEKMLSFCNNSGPLFILGSVGAGMLGNYRLGLIIYLAHILASLTVGITLRHIPTSSACFSKKIDLSNRGDSFGGMLSSAIHSAIDSILLVSGYVILFHILLCGLEGFGLVRLSQIIFGALGLDPSYAKPIFFGFFESVNGSVCASALTGSILPPMLISAIIGWSGVSVHLQVLSIIKSAHLSSRYYFLGKVMMCLISPIYTFLLLIAIPHDAPVFATQMHAAIASLPSGIQLSLLSVSYLAMGMAILFCFSVISKLIKKLPM